MEYIDEDVGISRRIEFPKADTPEVEAFTMEEVTEILKIIITYFLEECVNIAKKGAA